MKQCSRCKEHKFLSEFPKNKRRPDGHNTFCKLCHKAYAAEHYRKNRKTYLDRQSEYRAANADKIEQYIKSPRGRSKRADAEQRRNARKRGQVGEPYSREEIFDRDGWTCYLCGDDIDPALRRPNVMSASIDHVKPLSKSGLDCTTNVRASHLLCNVRKNAKEETDPIW